MALLGAAALLLATTSAAAAPPRFYGMNWDREIARGEPTNLEPEFAQMTGVGVQTVRSVFRWAEMEPDENGPTLYPETDATVAAAARNGFALLPVVLTTPGWARKHPDRTGSPPADPHDLARFLSRLVARYGSEGSFWLEHPELEKRPLRFWQIWNEPELVAYWNEPKFWVGYTKLVRVAYRALKRADPRARLVLAGSTGYSWRSLEHLYRQGIKGYFDVAAIHPYTGSAAEVEEIVRRNRRVLRRWGEPRKPLWITELSWPAAKGRMRPPAGLRDVVTDDRGMARRLGRAYRRLARPRDRRERVGRVYWYTWASRYAGRDDVFDYAGLLRFSDGRLLRKPAWYAFKRAAAG